MYFSFCDKILNVIIKIGHINAFFTRVESDLLSPLKISFQKS